MSPAPIMPGAEPMSHDGTTDVGVLVLHGFTGNPSSMRGVAQSVAGLDHHVELPLLPGHGTSLDDMVPTRWADWSGEVAAAHARLAQRADRIVVAGLSMGGALALWSAFHLSPVDGVVCINPATVPPGDDMVGMIQGMLDDGTEVAPAVGGDIADPDAVELAYDGSPLRAVLSMWNHGLAPMADRYHELNVPLLLITSRQDHVVEPANSEHLAANHGGDVEHVWLDRSFHVATQDYDAADIERRIVDFVARVASTE